MYSSSASLRHVDPRAGDSSAELAVVGEKVEEGRGGMAYEADRRADSCEQCTREGEARGTDVDAPGQMTKGLHASEQCEGAAGGMGSERVVSGGEQQTATAGPAGFVSENGESESRVGERRLNGDRWRHFEGPRREGVRWVGELEPMVVDLMEEVLAVEDEVLRREEGGKRGEGEKGLQQAEGRSRGMMVHHAREEDGVALSHSGSPSKASVGDDDKTQGPTDQDDGVLDEVRGQITAPKFTPITHSCMPPFCLPIVTLPLLSPST